MITSYRTSITPTWCPGCNNYQVLAGLLNAFTVLNIPTHKLIVNYDIGCAGNMADFIKSYAVHGLHGRAISVAMGEKMVNPKLAVCVIGGDGGVYGEGLNHLISAARANIDIKVFVSNNYLYSLTTGQTSPTTPKGAKTKSTPLGNINEPIDAVKLLKEVNPNIYVKRVESKNILELNKLIKESLEFKGFSLLDITQECVAFGKQLRS